MFMSLPANMVSIKDEHFLANDRSDSLGLPHCLDEATLLCTTTNLDLMVTKLAKHIIESDADLHRIGTRPFGAKP